MRRRKRTHRKNVYRKRRRWLSLAIAGGLVVLAVWSVVQLRRPGPWQRVFATREGLTGRRMANGEIIRAGAVFAALPHRRALGRSIELRYRDRVAIAPVYDVGPWNVDDAYWEQGERPRAEQGSGTYRKPTNPAGIDLSDALYGALGLRGNDYVEWRFIHRGYIPLPRLFVP